MSLQVVQFQYAPKFLGLSILNLYNSSKITSCGIFVIDNKNSVPFWVEFLNIVISKNNGDPVCVFFDRIMGFQ